MEYRHLSLSLVVAARMLPVFATDVFFGVVVGVLLPFLRTVFFFFGVFCVYVTFSQHYFPIFSLSYIAPNKSLLLASRTNTATL